MDQENQNLNHQPEVITPQAPPEPGVMQPPQSPDYTSPHMPPTSDQPHEHPLISPDVPEIVHPKVAHEHTAKHTPHVNHDRRSKLGSSSLIAGVLVVGIAYALPNLPFITKATNDTPFFISYGVLSLLCLAVMARLAIPSFKKNNYPNIAGLIGLILTLLVLYSAVSILVVYAFRGNN